MIKKDNDIRNFYFCETSDWKSIVLAEDENEAAKNALTEAIEVLDKEATVAFAMRVKKINTALADSDFLIKTQQIFSDMGLHKQAQAIKEISKK
jgi:hypothetical protein